MKLFSTIQRKKNAAKRKPTARRFITEQLEDRRMLAASVGWDGPGQGSSDLTYYIRNAPTGLSMQQVTSAIQTALSAWSSVVDVDFTPATQAGLQRSIDISFQRIDGAGSTLAYAYMPATSNRASSIAGDVVFDTSERWEIGNSQGSQAFDLVSVAVHEIGHALGLDHLTSQASIMYESISATEIFTGLDSSDITAIRQIYATRVTSSVVAGAGSTTVTTETTTVSTTSGTTSTATNGSTTGSTTTKSADARWLTMPISLLSTVNSTKIAEVFDKLDSDDSGAITSEEMSTRLKTFFTDKAFDTDANGSITAEEFKAGVNALQRGLFDKIDANDDGALDSTEVNTTVWETLGRADIDSSGGVSFEEFLTFQEKSMFDRYDSNGDGEISQDEVSESIWNRVSKKDSDASGTVSALEYQQRNRQGGARHGEHRRGGSNRDCSSTNTGTTTTDSSTTDSSSTGTSTALRSSLASSLTSALGSVLSRGIRRR